MPYRPKAKQIEALWYLCEGCADLILIARSGFGKSMIFQLALTLIGGICLMVSPLTLLSEDQIISLKNSTRIIRMEWTTCKEN